MARKTNKIAVRSTYLYNNGTIKEDNRLLSEESYKDWLKYDVYWHIDDENSKYLKNSGLVFVNFTEFNKNDIKIYEKTF